MKGKKLIIAAVVCVALLAGAAVWLLATPTATTQAGDKTLVLHSGTAADIQSLTIQNQYGPFNVQAKDGGFEVHDIPPMLVDYQLFVAMMNGSANMAAMRRLETTGGDVAAFGLDRPQATVDIEFADGSLSLAIGAQEAVSGGYYFQANGQPDVYLMAGEMAALYLLEPKMYIDHRATPPLEASSPLSAVLGAQFTGGSLDVPLSIQAATSSPELELRALSFGAVTHLVTRHDDWYEMDQTYGIEVLGSLLGIPAQDIVDYNCTEAEMAAYGFDQPWLTAEFDLQNGPDSPVEDYTLSLVPYDKGGWLLAVNHYGIVYQIGDLPFMNIDGGKLMLRWYLSPMIMDVSGLTVTTPTNQMDFHLQGDDNATRQVNLNGEALDMEAFRQFYKLLVSAANDGEAPPVSQPEGAPSLTIEYRYQNGVKQPDVIEFYPAGGRKLLVVVNGNAMEFGMREMYLQRVLSACEALPQGATFDTNW